MSNTWVAGGLGNCGSASDDNGGGYTTADGSWTDFQGANGAVLYNNTVAGAIITDEGSWIKFAIIGIGATIGNALGTYINVVWDANSDFVDDRYSIMDVATDYIGLNYAGGADPPGNGEDATEIWIGGALATIQKPLDDLVAAGDSVGVSNGKTHTLAATVDVDTTAGTVADHITIEGVVNTTGVRVDVTSETSPVIQASAGVDSLLNVHQPYYDLYSFDIDGNGNINAGKYTLWLNTQSSQTRCFDMRVYDGRIGIYVQNANNCVFVNVESFGHVNQGFRGTGSFRLFGCSLHDNGEDGLHFTNSVWVFWTLIYDNGGNGIDMTGDQNIIVGNTIYGNDGDGIDIGNGSDFNYIVNNSISKNGGWGILWDTAANSSQQRLLSHNHAFDNTSGATSTGTWATLGDGDNIAGDPLFESVVDGSEDFTPGDGSPLLGAGFPQYMAINGDLDAVTNFAHIGAMTREEPSGSGGLLTHPGMSGGIRG